MKEGRKNHHSLYIYSWSIIHKNTCGCQTANLCSKFRADESLVDSKQKRAFYTIVISRYSIYSHSNSSLKLATVPGLLILFLPLVRYSFNIQFESGVLFYLFHLWFLLSLALFRFSIAATLTYSFFQLLLLHHHLLLLLHLLHHPFLLLLLLSLLLFWILIYTCWDLVHTTLSLFWRTVLYCAPFVCARTRTPKAKYQGCKGDAECAPYTEGDYNDVATETYGTYVKSKNTKPTGGVFMPKNTEHMCSTAVLYAL